MAHVHSTLCTLFLPMSAVYNLFYFSYLFLSLEMFFFVCQKDCYFLLWYGVLSIHCGIDVSMNYIWNNQWLDRSNESYKCSTWLVSYLALLWKVWILHFMPIQNMHSQKTYSTTMYDIKKINIMNIVDHFLFTFA